MAVHSQCPQHHPGESAEIYDGLQNIATQNSTPLNVPRCLNETTSLMRHIGEEQLQQSGL